MPPINVGEKIGGRYFVIRAIANVEAGAIVDVRDPMGVVVWAQFLGVIPIPEKAIEDVRVEVLPAPDRPSFLRPDRLLTSTSGLPAAVFLREIPEGLGGRLLGIAADGPKNARNALVGAFARLAEDLAIAHTAQVVHGGINLKVLHATGTGIGLRVLLSGFGIEPSTRAGSPRPRPNPRQDLSALVLTLRDALKAASCEPDGPVLARWAVLTHCARAGDHPAFTSGRELADHLRALVLPEPSAKRAASAAAAPNTPKTAIVLDTPSVPSPVADSAGAPRGSRRNLWIGLTVVAVLLAAGIGAGMLHQAPERPFGLGLTTSHPQPTDCGGESVANPAGVSTAANVEQVDSLCIDDGSHVLLLGRADHHLVIGARNAVRGGTLAWGPVTFAEGVQELGTLYSSSEGAWVAYRTDGPSSFGISKISQTPVAVPFNLTGWSATNFRGAYLLHASASEVAIASTLDMSHGPVTVIVRADSNGVTQVYKICDGETLAAESGDPATLLVGSRDGHREVLQAITVPVATLPVLATLATGDAGASEDPRLLMIPAVSVQRSDSVTVDGDTVTAAPYGAGRRFLVTGTTTGSSDGTVKLVTLPPHGHGEASARVLTPQGHGMDLSARRDEGLVALFVRAGSIIESLMAPGGEPSTARLSVTAAERVRTLACGSETWVAYSTSQPQPRLAAVPLPCVSDR